MVSSCGGDPPTPPLRFYENLQCRNGVSRRPHDSTLDRLDFGNGVDDRYRVDRDLRRGVVADENDRRIDSARWSSPQPDWNASSHWNYPIERGGERRRLSGGGGARGPVAGPVSD